MRKMVLPLLCAFLFIAAPARAQQATPPAGYKDPGTATLLSVVIPGGGQLYSGDTRKGLTLLGVGLGGLTLGAAMTFASAGVSCSETALTCESEGSALPAVLGYVAYLGSWVYGIADASSSAKRMNTKHGLARVIPENVAPIMVPNGTGGTQVGLTMRF